MTVWRRRRPASIEFMRRALERGERLNATSSVLMDLLERYGAWALEAAGTRPPVALVLPEHVARRDAPVRHTTWLPTTERRTTMPDLTTLADAQAPDQRLRGQGQRTAPAWPVRALERGERLTCAGPPGRAAAGLGVSSDIAAVWSGICGARVSDPSNRWPTSTGIGPRTATAAFSRN